VQWQPPDGTTSEHSDDRLTITEDDGTIWRIRLMATGFAIGNGEEAALSDDVHASAAGLLDVKLGRIGDGRCLRVMRQLRDGSFGGQLIVPVAKGAVELGVRVVDLDVLRTTMDNLIGSLEITQPPERTREVELPGAGVACEPPLRFLPVLSEGKGTLIRSGLDGWQRVIEIVRIGRHKLKGRDLPTELVEHANKSVANLEKIQTQTTPIDDFGVCLQVEQVVQYVEHGAQRVGLMRWWIAGDQTLWRLSSTSPIGVEREELRRDLEQIQETFRRI
jgi:hypothetical protein